MRGGSCAALGLWSTQEYPSPAPSPAFLGLPPRPHNLLHASWWLVCHSCCSNRLTTTPTPRQTSTCREGGSETRAGRGGSAAAPGSAQRPAHIAVPVPLSTSHGGGGRPPRLRGAGRTPGGRRRRRVRAHRSPCVGVYVGVTLNPEVDGPRGTFLGLAWVAGPPQERPRAGPGPGGLDAPGAGTRTEAWAGRAGAGPGLEERGCSPGDPPSPCVGLSRESPGVMEAGEAAGPRSDTGLLVGVRCEGHRQRLCVGCWQKGPRAVALRAPRLGQECPQSPWRQLCLQSPGGRAVGVGSTSVESHGPG